MEIGRRELAGEPFCHLSGLKGGQKREKQVVLGLMEGDEGVRTSKVRRRWISQD